MGVIVPKEHEKRNMKKAQSKKSSSGFFGFIIFVLFVAAIFSFAISKVTKSKVNDENVVNLDFTEKEISSEIETSVSTNLYSVLNELPVIDKAGILSNQEGAQLKTFLENLSNSSGVQIAVLILPSLNGENIELVSLSYAEKFKLGQKGIDNGALLTVAMAEKELRIETGYGTEGVLTDLLCGRIIRNVIVPEFQKGNYGQGIIKGVENMAGIITSDESLVTLKTNTSEEPSSAKSVPFIIFLVYLFFWLFIITTVLRKKKRGSRYYHSGSAPFTSFHNHSGFSGGSRGFGGGGFRGGGGGFGGGGASGRW